MFYWFFLKVIATLLKGQYTNCIVIPSIQSEFVEFFCFAAFYESLTRNRTIESDDLQTQVVLLATPC